MASFDYNSKTHKARFYFRYDRTQFNKTLTMASEREAERLQGLIEETIQDIGRGKLLIPEGADVATFIYSGGKNSTKPKPVSDPLRETSKPETIATIFDTYAATLTAGSKEANSLATEAIHGRHFKRVLGADRRFDSLSLNVLQTYANERAHEGVVRDTIKKELGTLRVVWKWAFDRKHIAVPLAWTMKDLTLPKAHERPPFKTWDQITDKIARGGLSKDQQADQWECLWLNVPQTLECLAWVREQATRPFLYPMFAFAAYTGARRGEMLRSERDDWDFTAKTVTIRQKKADKSKSFTRRTVTIDADLIEIMGRWFREVPNSQWAVSTEDGQPIGPRMATKYFRNLVGPGKWSVLHGWHIFRHSLASNMASGEADQRIINDILGHGTEEMERRYRHMLPRKQADVLHSLFHQSPG